LIGRSLGGTLAIAGLHFSEWGTDRDLVVDGDEQFRDYSGGGSGYLCVDLVRGDLDNRVALVDEIALGHVPLEDDALGDRLAHLWHLDLHGRRLRHSSIECMKQP
jgi:hypothetical protein